jgi:polysaccharide export outer membrane protein
MLAMLPVVPGWAAPPTEYRFTPGDVIDVTVTPQHAFDRTITVQPDGKINYPRVGQLQAAGLTVAELAARLQEGLDHDLVDPRVTVLLKEASKQSAPRVSVLGAVRTPGVQEIREGMTVAAALATAGGPAPLADLRRVTITRADRSVITVDLAQTDKTGRLDGDVALQPGDFVVVPQGTPPTVLVLGEVMKPGPIDLQGEARLLDAISQAGGLTTKADFRRVTLARPGVAGTRKLDLQPLFTGDETTDAALNVRLQPGDSIVVAETEQRVYVLGRVAKPDLYAIKPDDRVLDVLVKAGGATPEGNLSQAVLVRQDASGRPTPKRLDLKKIMATGDKAENAVLRPGDVLFVPDKKTHRSLDQSLNLFWPITGILNFFTR